MQSPFVIVTGPQGCGKTLHASTLAAHLGCGHVVDGWTPGDGLVPGALHLTNEPMETLAVDYGDGPAPRVLPLPILREFADVALSCGLVAEGDGVAAPAVDLRAVTLAAVSAGLDADFAAADAPLAAPVAAPRKPRKGA